MPLHPNASLAESPQSDETVTICTQLCEYATNPKVQEAVRHADASYVLLLDKGVSYEDGRWIQLSMPPFDIF